MFTKEITIEPYHEGFRVAVGGWGTGAVYRTREGAERVAQVIREEAMDNDNLLKRYETTEHPGAEPCR